MCPPSTAFLSLFSSWSHFAVKPAPKSEVPQAALGISRDELQQIHQLHSKELSNEVSKANHFDPLHSASKGWFLISLGIHASTSTDTEMYECISFRYFSCFTGRPKLHIQSAATEISAPVAHPCLATAVTPLTFHALNRQQTGLKCFGAAQEETKAEKCREKQS